MPFWDRLCGTYRAEPRAGQAGIEIGLAEARGPRGLDLRELLAVPFRRAA